MTPLARSADRSSCLALLALLAPWGPGCAKIAGIEDTRVGSADAGDEIPACADAVIAEPLGAIPIDTDAADDSQRASCGDDGAGDQLLAWTAPVTDYYVFDTFGSGFDTVLALAADCSGQDLACSNNVGEMPQSELVRKYAQGEQAVIVVEGFAGDRGQGVLNISRVACPDADLEDQRFPVNLTTVSFGDDFAGACGGAGFEDRGYHWVAPADGLYAFTARSEGFTPTLAVVDGPRCGDRQLGCNAGAPGVRHAEVVRRLRAGQPVSVLVDGVDEAGTFEIEIAARAQTCPEAVLVPNAPPAMHQLTERTLAPSCGFSRVSGMFGGQFDLGDMTFSLDAPPVSPDCFGFCQITAQAQEELTVYALEGADCGGAEIACTSSSMGPAVEVPRRRGETVPYTIAVADAIPGDGDGTFTIEAFCVEACP